MISFSLKNRSLLASLACVLGLTVIPGGCDGAEPKNNGCEPGATTCQCTKQSDCAEGENCVNNACVAASSAAAAASGAGGGSSTSSGSTGSGTGGAAGEASSATDAGGGEDDGATSTRGSDASGGTGNVVPTAEAAVLLVLDRSTSAEQQFDGDESRWGSLVEALLEEGGAVQENAGRMAIGVLDFTGFNGGTCPDFGAGVAPGLDNFGDIEDYLSSLELPEDKSETPTREALEQAVQDLSARTEPKSIVLVTDGITDDTCDDFDNPGCITQAYYAAQQAYAAGVSTYILAIGDLEDDYLQGVANAGTGQAVQDLPDDGLDCGPEGEQPDTSENGGSAPFWQAENTDQIGQHLASIFQAILGE